MSNKNYRRNFNYNLASFYDLVLMNFQILQSEFWYMF